MATPSYMEDPAARERWRGWQEALGKWEAPNLNPAAGGSYKNVWDTMRGYMTNLLETTQAGRFLSPFYMARLKGQAGDLATIQQAGEMGASDITGAYANPQFLKNYLSVPEMGTEDLRNRTQALLNRIRDPGSTTGKYFYNDKTAPIAQSFLASLLALASTGMFSSAMPERMKEAIGGYPAFESWAQKEGMQPDWVQYLLGQHPGSLLPSLGYSTYARSGW